MNFRLRPYLAIAAAASTLAMASTVAAQADNSNSAIAPAQPGARTMTYGGTSSYYGPYYGYSNPHQPYADERARQRAYAEERADPNSETSHRSQGWSNVDPSTGTVTAPGYMGPKDASK